MIMSARFQTFEYDSIDDLCELIAEKTAGWDTRWYRGAKSQKYNLLPTLFRDKTHAAREGYIAVEFRRRAATKLKGMSSAFDWLCAMQHFGIPTRLLDWSESLSVALYFSVRPVTSDLDLPTIWVLDPFGLYTQSFSGDQPRIPIASSPEVLANSDLAFDEENMTKHVTEIPLPVAPNFIFERLSVQNGCFTIHGKSPKPLESFCAGEGSPMLFKFVAKKDCVKKIYNTLDHIIPCDDAIYPDLEGLKAQLV
jgi:hypothetical protein